MTQYSAAMQQAYKLALQELRRAGERPGSDSLKASIIKAATAAPSLPQSQLQLRPHYMSTPTKQPLSRQEILKLSRALRNTHQPSLLSLKFSIPGLPSLEEQEKKIQAVTKLMRQRQLDKRHHLQNLATEEKYEQEHDLLLKPFRF